MMMRKPSQLRGGSVNAMLQLLVLLIVVSLLPQTIAQDASSMFNFYDCGESKSCFLPQNCNSINNCSMGASYQQLNATLIQFEIFAVGLTDPAYVALGFSPSSGIANSSVTECLSTPNSAEPSASYNYIVNGNLYNYVPQPNISSSDASRLFPYYTGYYSPGGLLYCKIWQLMNPQLAAYWLPNFSTQQNYTLVLTKGTMNGSSQNPPIQTAVSSQPMPIGNPPFPFDVMACNQTKQCFLVPQECVPSAGNCTMAGSIARAGGGTMLQIELLATTTSAMNYYVAMGFSRTQTMGYNYVTQCASFNNAAPVGNYSYNLAANETSNGQPTNVQLTNNTDSVSTLSTIYISGMLYCLLQQPLVPSGYNSQVPNFAQSQNNTYYLLLAQGATDQYGLTQHTAAFASPTTYLVGAGGVRSIAISVLMAVLTRTMLPNGQ